MRAVLACLALAFAPSLWAQAPATPSPQAIDIPRWFSESFLDFREDIREAGREGKRLLVYFGQDGCPYCKALMKVNFSEPDIVATTRAKFVAVALNLWGDREVTWIDGRTMTEKELGRRLGVQFTPTLLFFDEKGMIALRLNGYQPPDRFRVALDYASRRGMKQPFNEFLAARDAGWGRPTPDLGGLLARGKPVLVMVGRKSCRECDELQQEAFKRPDVAKLLQVFTLERADLAGPWATKQRVTFAPSLLFFDRTGKEVFRTEGYLRPFHVASALEYVAGGAYAREPSFQRFVQARADALRAAGAEVDLWK